MALPKRATPPAPQVEGPNFGDLNMYVAGGGLPEGDYCMFFKIQMHDGFGTRKGPPRLGVMADCYHLDNPTEMKQQFWSMGSGADKSFAPNAETGKSLVAVPGGPGATLNNSTNWAMFLKSLYDSGLPQGIFGNDISVLDGIWVHTTNIPEPEERKGFQSKTGEGMEERRPGVISIISEIKEGGAPWEGGGGLPKAGTAPARTAGNKAVGAPVASRPNGKPAPPPAPAQEASGEELEEQIRQAATDGTYAVLEKNPSGTSKLALRTQTFAAVKQAHSEDMAGAVIESHFSNDTALNAILSQHGYKVEGPKVVPA
jgi:hypothetical protein